MNIKELIAAVETGRDAKQHLARLESLIPLLDLEEHEWNKLQRLSEGMNSVGDFIRESPVRGFLAHSIDPLDR